MVRATAGSLRPQARRGSRCRPSARGGGARQHELLGEQRPDDLGGEHRVLPHELPLLRVQAARLEQHAVGDADLADVVQVGRLLDLAEISSDQPSSRAEHHHVRGDARGVAERVVVLGVEGRAQRLEVAQVHPLDLFVEPGVLDGQRQLRADALQQLAVERREGVLAGCRQVRAADELARRTAGRCDAGARAGRHARRMAGAATRRRQKTTTRARGASRASAARAGAAVRRHAAGLIRASRSSRDVAVPRR